EQGFAGAGEQAGDVGRLRDRRRLPPPGVRHGKPPVNALHLLDDPLRAHAERAMDARPGDPRPLLVLQKGPLGHHFSSAFLEKSAVTRSSSISLSALWSASVGLLMRTKSCCLLVKRAGS